MAAPAFSLPSNFTFEPQLASEYAAAAFVEAMQLLARSTGVVDEMGLDSIDLYHGGGEFIDMPFFGNVASLISRRDITSEAAPTDLGITGLKERAVIVRRKAGPVKFTEDVFIRGIRRERVEQEIGRQIGNYAALEVRQRLLAVAKAALAGIAGTAHTVTSIYAAADHATTLLTYARIQAMRMKLADAYNQLTTIVMHSNVFNDLLLDGLTTYKIETVGGYSIVTGDPRALGMRYVVVDDPSLRVTNGGNFVKYRTFLFGPGALRCIYQQRLRIEAERRLDFEAPYWRVLANFDFAPHLHGTKWTSATANPDNATLATAGNWDESYNDHREVLAVDFEHNASAD